MGESWELIEVCMGGLRSWYEGSFPYAKLQVPSILDEKHVTVVLQFSESMEVLILAKMNSATNCRIELSQHKDFQYCSSSQVNFADTKVIPIPFESAVLEPYEKWSLPGPAPFVEPVEINW